MEFTEVLNPKAIAVHLKVQNKAEALDAMAEMLLEAGTIRDKEVYIKDIVMRERRSERPESAIISQSPTGEARRW